MFLIRLKCMSCIHLIQRQQGEFSYYVNFPVFIFPFSPEPAQSSSPHYLLETMNRWFKSAVHQNFFWTLLLNWSTWEWWSWKGHTVGCSEDGCHEWNPLKRRKDPLWLFVLESVSLIQRLRARRGPMFQVISTIVQRHILNEYRNTFHSEGSGLFFYLLHNMLSVAAYTKYYIYIYYNIAHLPNITHSRSNTTRVAIHH